LGRPLPLETDLVVAPAGVGKWSLLNPSDGDAVILEASTWEADFAATSAITIEQAEAARAEFGIADEDHPAPHCCSCGVGPESLRVQAGPLGDGRWATPFRVGADRLIGGRVDESLIWMAVDCACGWYTGQSTTSSGGTAGSGVTVQLAVDVLAPIQPDTDYAIVAWCGDYPADWDGRKRGAAAAVFDADGALVVQSRSFWVRPG